MFKRFSLAMLIPLLSSLALSGGLVATAASKSSSSSKVSAVKSGDNQGLGYAVKPSLPDNQRKGTVGYYDVKLKAGETQTLTGTIYNLNNSAIEVQPQLNIASTNSSGTIDYGKSKNAMDHSLINKITNFAHFKETIIKVPAKSKQTYHLTVKMPAKSFKGVMAGGIRFFNVSQDQQTKQQNLQFKNEYAYVIGLVLQNSTQALAPELTLGSVRAATVNGGNTILSDLHNTTAAYFNGFNLKAIVRKQGSQKTVYSATSQNLNLAPNSILAYPLSLKGTPLKGGMYTMELIATGKYGEPLHFSRNFKISAQNASAKNKSDVYIAAAAKANAIAAAQQRKVIFLSILGTAGVLGLIVGIWWLIRRKKQH